MASNDHDDEDDDDPRDLAASLLVHGDGALSTPYHAAVSRCMTIAMTTVMRIFVDTVRYELGRVVLYSFRVVYYVVPINQEVRTVLGGLSANGFIVVSLLQLQ